MAETSDEFEARHVVRLEHSEAQLFVILADKTEQLDEAIEMVSEETRETKEQVFVRIAARLKAKGIR